jgi:hypothetical protein
VYAALKDRDALVIHDNWELICKLGFVATVGVDLGVGLLKDEVDERPAGVARRTENSVCRHFFLRGGVSWVDKFAQYFDYDPDCSSFTLFEFLVKKICSLFE